MKKISFIFGLAVCFSIIYFSLGKPVPVLGIQNSMELVIEPGENWLSKMNLFLFFSKTNTPQMAAWIEDNNGIYISTISATEKSVKGNWIAAPKEGRPEALPVWNHRRQNFSTTNDLDVISSATAKGSFKAKIDGDFVIGNTYNVFLEINHSFDYNNYWTKDNSGVNGQPSLIYHAQFIAGQQESISLVPAGHGSVDGSNGNIISDLENITTALSIMRNASINFE